MNDQRDGVPDWAIPAILACLGLLFVGGLGLAVSHEQRAEPPSLILDLDRYTECLIDHGADAPRVASGPDGGFSVIVPQSLVAGHASLEALTLAAEECVDVAPDVFGGLFGGLSRGWLEGAGSTPRPADADQGRRPPWSDGLRRRCERLETAGNAPTGPRIDRLRRECERLDR